MQRLRRQYLKRFFANLALAGMLAHVLLITLHSTAVLARSATDAEHAGLLSQIAGSICGPGRQAGSDHTAADMAIGQPIADVSDQTPDSTLDEPDCPLCSSLSDLDTSHQAKPTHAIQWPRPSFVPQAQHDHVAAPITLHRHARAPPPRA